MLLSRRCISLVLVRIRGCVLSVEMLRLRKVFDLAYNMGRRMCSSIAKDPNLLKQINPISIAPLFPLYRPHNKIVYDQVINTTIIESPRNSYLNEIRDIIENKYVDLPPLPYVNEVEAARLIVIRRRKMKKHKLKKLRKKMKFEWAKVRQRREMRKEKAFQGGLISQIKQAEKFSAENYVMNKLTEANQIPIPRYWKGKRLPQFIIKQKLGIS